MSDRFDLRANSTCDWGDVRLYDFRGDVEKMTVECATWSGPFQLVANDPVILMQYLEALEKQGWPTAEEFWNIFFEDVEGNRLWKLSHPTIEQVRERLTSAGGDE